ncbi:H-NS histone family protein [Paracoccus denitrificans]|jgi:DNA-binding protein H-NS|uniref:Nucleoid protein H-NS n=1 Tax=Paracoccus denitrificans (strain Pd 1222) TaxID=318586 RepID=A1B7C8_PARDP|nr:H-NS histone family protein [Paracoccus denitrificans]ABL71422.1 nucleoid protein H-NS [Paracoccus denitrificans PD1222]MBB4630161.1 DNA-binding protein H-NS [Paracoccus denitrificans]MCU7430640.1 H-NS histone family protein [Paracoccus denitrificans]QAR28038.1 H-NS histone family protein [Paracoccus denitrificans]UPV97760.1 H-NS histone family protein [Paracoccus denitrificans]
MTDIDLNALSLAELKQLEKNLAKAIASFEDRRKAEAGAAAEAVAKEHGFSLGELAKMTPAQKRAAVAPKYRHPENPEITWSSRGREPGWIAEALEAGKSLEDFAI